MADLMLSMLAACRQERLAAFIAAEQPAAAKTGAETLIARSRFLTAHTPDWTMPAEKRGWLSGIIRCFITETPPALSPLSARRPSWIVSSWR